MQTFTFVPKRIFTIVIIDIPAGQDFRFMNTYIVCMFT